MRFRTSHLGAAAACLALLAACAAGQDRQAFTDDKGTTPELPPEQGGPPGKTPQSGPVTEETDSGADAPAEVCKTTAPSNKCGLTPQCGCTLAETCDVDDGAGNVACVVAGKAAMGHPCTTTSGCARGLTCVFGTCHAYCPTAGVKCAEANTGDCLQVKNTSSVDVPNLKVCLVACDLRDPNGCGGTTAAGTGVCGVDSTGKTDCQSGGTRTVNQTCSPTEECGPSLVCVGSAGTSTCKKWCRVGTNDCGGAAVCGSFSTKVMVGATEYGACP